MTLVTVLDADWSRTYGIDDIEQFLLEPPEPPPAPRRPEVPYIGPERPGDAFTATVDAGELLVASGWTLHHADRNGDRHYTRPGKERRDGSSATVYADGHCCVWTDATALEPRRWYDAFGLYVALHHGGDYGAAAAELGRQGYGTRHVELTFIRPQAEQQADQHADEPWPDPVPLRNATDLPPFPVHALPTWIAEHASAVAAEIQAPVDLPATLGIAALSVAVSRRARVAVRGNWTEPANLYLVVAMPPSSGKSPAYNAMIRPLRDFEKEQLDKSTAAIARRAQERRIAEAGMKKAEAKGDADEAAQFLLELLGSEALHPPRLMTDDATPEAVVRMLGEQKGRLAIMSPEGGLFDMMAGRYSDQSNLDPYLKAWSGDTIIVDRMSRETITVDNPALTIGLTVQPSVIAALGEKPEMAGRGLTARFMYSIPPDVVGRRNMIDPPIADPALAVEYRRRLLGITSAEYVHPSIVELEPQAQAAFLSWRQALEDQRGTFGDMRPMAEWSTKLESSVARLALLLHVADHGHGGTIDAETMRRAIEVGDYWIEHGKAAHDMWVVDPVRGAALAILDYVKQKGVAEFTVRDLWRGMRRRFTKPADLIDPLVLLIETGWMRKVSDGPLEVGKGKTSPTLVAHPLATPQSRNVAPVAPVAHKEEKSSISSSSFEKEDPTGVPTGATGATSPVDEKPEGMDPAMWDLLA